MDPKKLQIQRQKIADFGKGQVRHRPSANEKTVYENYNKLPGLVGDYRVSMLRALKGKFVEQLDIAKAEEAAYCLKTGAKQLFDDTAYNQVLDLLVQCNSIFDIEALARYVFDENEIPTMEKIKSKAFKMRLSFPIQIKN